MKVIVLNILIIFIVISCSRDWSNSLSPDNNSNDIPANGLVAYYPFNGNANDESGNENNGIVIGATLTSDRFGNPNSAYYFDGIDDFINCGSNSVFNISSEITISFWAKFDEVYGAILTKWKTESGWRGSWVIDPASFSITNNGWDGRTAVIDPVLMKDVYYHIVCSYSSNKIIILVNGIERGSGTGNGGIFISDAKVRIGGNHWYSNGWRDSFAKGIIDDIRIYGRALTNDEIDALYHENGWDE